MIAFIVLYDKPDRDHVQRWTVDVTDLDTAKRVVGQLHRRHVRTDCAQCPATHYTISTKVLGKGMWRIIDAGMIVDV